MTIAITPVTAANANFGPLGSAAWAAGMQMTGLGTNQLLYSTGATALAQSANLLYSDTLFNSQPGLQIGAGGATAGLSIGTFASGFSYFWTPAVTPSATNYWLRTDGSSQIVLQPTVYVGSANAQRIRMTGGVSNPTIAFGGSLDAGIGYISTALLGIGNGSDGSFAGRLKLTSAIAAGVAIASLNASPTTGEVQSVTDALAPAAGSAVASGGSAKALVWWNGAQWTVIGV